MCAVKGGWAIASCWRTRPGGYKRRPARFPASEDPVAMIVWRIDRGGRRMTVCAQPILDEVKGEL